MCVCVGERERERVSAHARECSCVRTCTYVFPCLYVCCSVLQCDVTHSCLYVLVCPYAHTCIRAPKQMWVCICVCMWERTFIFFLCMRVMLRACALPPVAFANIIHDFTLIGKTKNLKRHSVCHSESTKKKSARFSMSSLCTRQSNVVQTSRQVENVMICPLTKGFNSLHWRIAFLYNSTRDDSSRSSVFALLIRSNKGPGCFGPTEIDER